MDIDMSDAGNVDDNSDDNIDIYKDIGDFHFDKELIKLEESNKAYLEDIKRLSAKVKELTDKNIELQSINDTLKANISTLLKTAKVEIDRKQLAIEDFRKQTEDTNVPSYFKEDDSENLGLCKECGIKLSTANIHDPEDGEVIKNKSKEEDIKSEVGGDKSHKSKDKTQDSEQSVHHKKKKKSHERSRGHGHRRSSWCSKERHSHHSRSSRSRRRYRSRSSEDERRHSSRRKRSRGRSRSSRRERSRGRSRSSRRRKSMKRSHSSDYAYKSRSQKRKHISRSKDIIRRSEERRRSRHSRTRDSCKKVNSPAPTSSLKSEKNYGNTESSSRVVSVSEHKTNVFRSDSTSIKNRSEEKEIAKTEMQKKEESEGTKNLKSNDCHERKSGNCSGNSCAAKEYEGNLGTRQSAVFDLFDEAISCGKFVHAERPKDPKVMSECDKDSSHRVDTSSDESWTVIFGKKPLISGKPKTLYSRRMETKLKQELKEDEINSEGKCGENDSANEEKYLKEKRACGEKEKEEGEISFERDKGGQIAEDIVRKDKLNKNAKETPFPDENKQVQGKLFIGKTCADVDPKPEKQEQTATDRYSEQSFGEYKIKKMLDLKKQEEPSGIKEFSPLKHNYKLSKISPFKSVKKQHILEYYNLKPAQQLSNIEPEVLDYSFSVPATPGKYFSNPFPTQEPVRDDRDDKLKISEEEPCVRILNSNKKADVSKENYSKSVRVEETAEGSKLEKDEKGSSPEGKKLRKTRAVRKLGPDTEREKQIESTHATPKSIKNNDTMTYQIRTRSRAGNESRKYIGEMTDATERRGKALNKNKSTYSKRKRGAASSEEEAEEEREQKYARKKANSGAEIEVSKRGNEVEKDKGNEKGLDRSKTKVFRSKSVLEAADDVTVREKNLFEERSSSNVSHCRAINTSCSGTPKKLTSAKVALPTGNTGDSSTFKVLKSYILNSARGVSDVEAFNEDSTSSSGDYSDSGASAFVDLL